MEVPEASDLQRSESGHPLAPDADLKGRRFLITGAAGGIGLVTAEGLIERGAQILLGARSWDRASPSVAWLRKRHPSARVQPFAVDVSNLKDVERAARELVDKGEPLDGLINNAGLAGVHAQSADGFELAYATNHLGPFLLTERLLPLLQVAPQGRVVMVASQTHFDAKGIPWGDFERPIFRPLARVQRYAVTKLLNVLYARELARRLEGSNVTTYAVHPGVVATGIWRKIPPPFSTIAKRFMLSVEDGAQTQLRCASDPELASESGGYWVRCRRRTPSALAQDDALEDRLRDESLAQVRRVLGDDAL